MYIENSDLAAKHAVITLNHYCQYLLRDVSSEPTQDGVYNGGDCGGIWIKVPTTGDGVDLYKTNNFRRKFRIEGGEKYKFEFVEDEEDMDEVGMFLTKMNIFFALFPMQNEEVNTF